MSKPATVEPTTVPRMRKPRSRDRSERPIEAPPIAVAAPSRLGKYELLFEIGRGGMGSVHAARTRDEHGVERMIALKCLPKERATKEALAALTAEAKITATIDHPNVVDTFEFGVVEGGAAYLAMRLIEGVPLSRVIERAKALSEPIAPGIAAWIAAQAARGLHAAHELTTKGGERFAIVHRDVSPANLLVSRDGRAYVVDFGIAKLVANDIRTASGVIKGKFAYMSPEQTRGSDVDARSDQFSLGVVLYELLTGISPFLASNPAESIYRINHVDPKDVRTLVPDVPEALAAVVRRCMARDAADRFPTAGALADALRGAMKQSGDAVDEADVAAWIDHIAGDDLRALRDKIAEAARRPIGLVAATTETRPASEALVEPRSRRRAPWIGGAVAIALAIAIGVAFAATRDRSPSSEPSTSAALVSATAAATADATAPPTASAAVTAISSAAVEPTASTTPSSSPSIAAPEPRPRPPSVPSTQPSIAPAKSSHKGEPFRTLGG